MSITVKAMTDDQLRELSQCIRQVVGDRKSLNAPGGQDIPFRSEVLRPPNDNKRPDRKAYQRHEKVMVMAQNDHIRDGFSILFDLASELYTKAGIRDYISIVKKNPVTSAFALGGLYYGIPYIGSFWAGVFLYLTS